MAQFGQDVQSAQEPESDKFDEEIITLIADSDSFDGFEDLDLSKLQIDSEPAKRAVVHQEKGLAEPIKLNFVNPKNGVKNARSTTTPISKNAAEERFAWRPSSRSFSPIPFLIVGGVCLVLVLGFFGSRLIFNRNVVAAKSELEKSSIGYKYGKALFDLRKAERVMSYMENGYKEKRLPESELASVNETKEKFQNLVNDQSQLRHANELYESGDVDGARKILNEQSQEMAKLQKEIERQTGWLKAKVFGG